MAQHLATPTDAPEHAPVPAFDIVAELNGVVLHPDSTRFDRYVALNALHRIALDINARMATTPALTDVADLDADQRAGRACTVCGLRFDLIAVHRAPVGKHNGHTLFACDWTGHAGGAA